MVKIDSHVHIYPDKIAAKAAKGIGKFYDITIHHDGSLTQMIVEEDKAGVSRMIAHSVATTPTQVAHINEFIMSARDTYPDRIIPFAALHPDTPDMENVLKGIVAAGFKGIKLHPDFQEFQLDEPRALHVFSRSSPPPNCPYSSTPATIATTPTARMAAERECPTSWPSARIWAAGRSPRRGAQAAGQPSQLYVDTSSALYALKPDRRRTHPCLWRQAGHVRHRLPHVDARGGSGTLRGSA